MNHSTVPPFHLSTLIALYLALQVLIPLRHLIYPGNVAWTEEGHRFSWRMKLRDKEGTARFFVHDPRTRETIVVEPATVLESWQAAALPGRPDMVLQFAHHLASEHGGTDRPVEVRAQVVVSLNSGESRLLVDPRVDLASERRTLWPAPWITRGDDVRDVFAPR